MGELGAAPPAEADALPEGDALVFVTEDPLPDTVPVLEIDAATEKVTRPAAVELFAVSCSPLRFSPL